eukprot:3934460-Rhodomonas_salina.1
MTGLKIPELFGNACSQSSGDAPTSHADRREGAGIDPDLHKLGMHSLADRVATDGVPGLGSHSESSSPSSGVAEQLTARLAR